MARRRVWSFGIVAAVLAGLGCHHAHDLRAQYDCCKPPEFTCRTIPDVPLPKELNKVSLPPYVVETPDVLQIEAVRVIPLPPHRLEPLDVLYLSAENVFETAPLAGAYPIDADGTINLGARYGGALRVADLTTDEARQAIQNKVRQSGAKLAVVVASLAQSRGVRQITGRHVVRHDGTVSLGSYGSVYVAGMSLAQVKEAIEEHLSNSLYKPEVSVDVFASHSKFYYVITDFGGGGEQVTRLAHVGNETVLDAVALVGGLSAVSNRKVWVARPAPTECGDDQILPVDWCGVTRRGQVKTNYQLMPFDRVYVVSQPPTKFDACVGRMLAPVQRALGEGLLSSGNSVGSVAPILP